MTNLLYYTVTISRTCWSHYHAKIATDQKIRGDVAQRVARVALSCCANLAKVVRSKVSPAGGTTSASVRLIILGLSPILRM
jgi:hypothetical protein